ncbi:MAG: hypothetical protein ACREOC_18720 [Gemmatimonadales bacterium]
MIQWTRALLARGAEVRQAAAGDLTRYGETLETIYRELVARRA